MFFTSWLCISQLLSIVHEINLSFKCAPSADVRGVFLDISKTFDKVWHPGFLYKLELYEVKGKLLDVLTNYLRERVERVVLDGQCSSWERVLFGIPQRSAGGLLLFLIYINDLQINFAPSVKHTQMIRFCFFQFMIKCLLGMN